MIGRMLPLWLASFCLIFSAAGSAVPGTGAGAAADFQQTSGSLSPQNWPPGELEKWRNLNTQNCYPECPHPLAQSTHGAVAVSTNALAAGAGLQALRQGGNCVDAIIAAATSECVLAINSYVSLAGVASVLVMNATTGKTTYVDGGWDSIAANNPDLASSTYSPSVGGGIGVGGFLSAMESLATKYAKFSLGTLLEPATYFAQEGFVVPPVMGALMYLHEKALMQTPAGRSLFTNPSTGAIYRAGEKMTQPEVAAFLRNVSTHGARAYAYQGPWAEEVVAVLRSLGSNTTLQDYADYVTEFSQPDVAYVSGSQAGGGESALGAVEATPPAPTDLPARSGSTMASYLEAISGQAGHHDGGESQRALRADSETAGRHRRFSLGQGPLPPESDAGGAVAALAGTTPTAELSKLLTSSAQYGGVSAVVQANLMEVSGVSRDSSVPCNQNATSFYWLIQFTRWTTHVSPVAALSPAAAGYIGYHFGLNLTLEHRLTVDHAKQVWGIMSAPGGMESIRAFWKSFVDGAGPKDPASWLARQSVGSRALHLHSDSIVAADAEGNICSMIHTANTGVWQSGVFVSGVHVPNAAKTFAPFSNVAHGGRVSTPKHPMVLQGFGGDPGSAAAISVVGEALSEFTLQVLDALLHQASPKQAVDGPFFYGMTGEGSGYLSSQIVQEGTFSKEFLDTVRGLGQPITEVSVQQALDVMGVPVALVRNGTSRVISAGSTPFGNGSPAGL